MGKPTICIGENKGADRGGSNEYPQSMFWSKNKKNRYTPAYPSFTILKCGLRGYTFYGHVFPIISGFDDISCEKTVEVSDYYKDITKMYMIERVFGQVFPQFKKLNSSTAIKNTQGVYVRQALLIL